MPVSLFNIVASGSGTAGTTLWINLGVITTGFKHWVGTMRLTSPDKSLTFDIRTNNVGQTAGTTGATTSLYKASASPRSGTLTVDCHKNGRLHIATIAGNGTSKWWLLLTSKSGTAGSYLYDIYYTTE